MKTTMDAKYIISLLFIVCNIGFIHTAESSMSICTYKTIENSDGDKYKIKCMLGDTIIGYIKYSYSDTSGTDAYIKTLQIQNEYRYCGVGSDLFIKALIHIKELQSPAVRWHTKEAIPFYKRFGARVIQQNKDALDFMEFSFEKDGDPKENLERYKREQSKK